MATDVQADIDKMIEFVNYPNSYFFQWWEKFADPLLWDGQSCSEIACCISYLAGNIDKIEVSNYAQGLVNLFNLYLSTGSTPRDGAFIWFDYGDGNGISHTGRVMGYDSSRVYTFEGNVGGRTVHRDYALNDPTIALYGYPAYTGQQYDTYQVRIKSPEDENLPEYNTTGSGGYNSNTQGTGPVSGADVLYSDIGYSQGRMMEMLDDAYSGNTRTPVNNTPSSFVQGGIASDGTNTTDANRIRFSGWLNWGTRKFVQFDIPAGWKLSMAEYSTNSISSFIRKLPDEPRWYTRSHEFMMLTQGRRYRLVLAKTDDSNITPADYSGIGFRMYSFADYYPVTNAAYNIYNMFNGPASDWLQIAADHNFTIQSSPVAGAVAVWASHVANVEQYANSQWYVSESLNDRWQSIPLDTNGIQGYIIPFTVPYPPIGPVPPPSGSNFYFKPYWRHQRRGRGA